MCVDPDEIHLEFFPAESFDSIALVKAQKTVINKDACEIITHGLMDHHGGNRGIHAAGQGAKNAFVPDFFFQFRNGISGIAAHFPAAETPADVVQKIVQDLLPEFCVFDFRMKLNGIDFFLRVFHGSAGTAASARCDRITFRRTGDLVRVAHPADKIAVRFSKQRTVDGLQFDPAVFSCGCCRHSAAVEICNQLRAVADAEDRNVLPQDLLRILRRLRIIDAVGTAGKNDAFRRFLKNLIKRRCVGHHFTVNAEIAHAARDQMAVLSAKIKDNDKFAHIQASEWKE